ncbi:MAG: trehalose-6-phosphate synthase, partial [Acidimicrobiia bacterium]
MAFGREPDGSFTARRGAGGVVSALAPLLEGRTDTRWVAAAITDEDRAAVAAGAVTVAGLDIELLAFDPEMHRLHYDAISNRVLWFWVHGLFDRARQPVFDAAMHRAWEAYHAVNEEFALNIAATAPEGDVVLVQDFHLLLVAGRLAALRPDLAVAHFTHTPFATASELAVLPDAIGHEMMAALASVPTGFHTERWARAFDACAAASGPTPPASFAATFSPDAESLHAIAAGPDAREARSALRERLGDRRAIVRTDRVELSKNIGRGFLAFDELLARFPEWR